MPAASSARPSQPQAPSLPRQGLPRQGLPRQGPRPLGLHLTGATGAWLSSRAALPLLKSGSLPWRPDSPSPAEALSLALGSVKTDSFAAALDGELTRRAALFLDGIERYRSHPYHRDLPEPPVLWQEGTTRLLDYRPRGGPPVLWSRR